MKGLHRHYPKMPNHKENQKKSMKTMTTKDATLLNVVVDTPAFYKN